MCHRSLLIALALLLAAPAHAATPQWRDLNDNGRQDPYEDPRAPVATRVADLLAQMTLDEKLGTLLHASAPNAPASGDEPAGYDLVALEDRIGSRHITSFVTRLDRRASSRGRTTRCSGWRQAPGWAFR